MHADTVGEAFVDALYSGLGGTIYLPGIMRYAAMLVSLVSFSHRYLAVRAKFYAERRSGMGDSGCGGGHAISRSRF